MPNPAPETHRDHKPPADQESTLLDTHVHIHDCFELPAFLDQACENFARQSSAGATGDVRRVSADRDSSGTCGVLLLTESHGVDAFGRLRGAAETREPIGSWRPGQTDEAESLRLVRQDGRALVVVAGRQIVTGERLEILALGMLEDPDDGLPIADVIDLVQQRGALCVLPWGFGKWTGRRGRIVRDILAAPPGRNFFLGDNAGRLGLWPPPGEFARAASLGIPVLAGTDPLPWPSQAGSAGRFGSRIETALDERRPFASLRRHLISEDREAETFGRLERLVPFVTHQVGMQLRNRLS